MIFVGFIIKMSWVKEALAELSVGRDVKIRPQGGSMRGRIESGQLVTLTPAMFNDIQIGDVVFIRWKGNYLLHIIKDKSETEILVGNNIGKINGWAPANSILAKVVNIED